MYYTYTATIKCQCGRTLLAVACNALLEGVAESELQTAILGFGERLPKLHCQGCHKDTDISSDSVKIKIVGTNAARAITDREEVRKIFHVDPMFKDQEEVLLDMLVESGAILEGHFFVLDDQG